MKTTLSIQLGHRIFQMDDLAYERLRLYLDGIDRILRMDTHKDEIISDIELRIGELFEERLQKSQRAIDLNDVLEMIAILGQPEVFGTDQSSAHKSEESRSSVVDTVQHDYREIFRDEQDAVVGGVCSGLSHYLRWDPLVLRVVMVVLMFVSFGTAFIAYLIAWALIPPARSTAERLRMKGSEVNLENIQKMVKEESLKATENVKRWGRQMEENQRTGGRPWISGVGKFLAIFLGGVALLLGMGIVILMMASLVLVDFQWWDSELSYAEAMNLLLPFGQGVWITWGIVLVLAGPALSLMYTGVRWIFGIGGRKRWFHGMTTVFFVFGIVALFYGGWILTEEFDTPATLSHREVLSQINSDTLILKVNDDPYFLGRSSDDDGNEFLELYTETEDSRVYGAGVNFRIEQTDRSYFYYEVEYESRGSRLAEAGKNAQEIRWNSQLEGNQWSVDPFIFTPKSSPYRAQKVRVILYVPINKTVCVSPNWSWISWQNEFDDKCLTHLEGGWQRIKK
ncbi:MAG: hypothetical protein RL362_944 [Bacteroidota bacterium]